MRMQIGLLSIVGFFGLLATADAQTPSASTAERHLMVHITLSLGGKSQSDVYIEQRGYGPLSGPDTGSADHPERSSAIYHRDRL